MKGCIFISLLQKGEDVLIVNNYDVLKFIEHGGRCRPAMDYVSGELLIYRLKRCPEIEKTLLFEWMRELLHQLEQFHRCRSNQSYRYVNPYSVLVTAEGKLLLLDLEAESNEFVLRNMQKRSMREHFVKPVIYIRENTKISLDLYGYAKTIQFILANVHVEPSLTPREENRLEKIIDKCLCKNSKKQYEDLKQVQRDLPSAQSKHWKSGKKIQKKWLLLLVSAIGLIAILFIVYAGITRNEVKKQALQEQNGNAKKELAEPQNQNHEKPREIEDMTGLLDGMEEDQEQIDKKMNRAEAVPDGMEELTDNVDVLQKYMLRNTTQDNQEIIERGEILKRELFRYLAAAYDREDMKEKALEAYQELCKTEEKEELLEAVYLRRIALEMEQSKEKAFETGKEALSRIPDSEILAEKALEVLAGIETMTKEQCWKEVEYLSGCYTDLKNLKNYHRLEEIYELAEGGGQDEDKNTSAGN